MTDAFATSLTVRAIGWALVQSLWQGAVVGALTALVLAGLRRSTASHRYTTLCLGLAVITALPIVTASYARRRAPNQLHSRVHDDSGRWRSYP